MSYELDRRGCAEIALIYDEESHHVISEAFNQQLFEVFRNYDCDIVGAPIARYFHHDMDNPNMPDFKLYIFVNTIYLTDVEREVIRRKLAKNHATALFLYGAGIMNPDSDPTLDMKHSEALTGIRMEYTDGVYDGKFKVLGEHPIARTLEDDVLYGAFDRRMQFNSSGYRGKVREIENNLLPLITEDDPEAETVARFADSGKPALSVKDLGDFVSIYCGSKYVNNEVVRAVAAFAGCHIWCDTNDVLYANRSYVVLHAASGGEKVIHLPRPMTATEVYQNKVYAEGASEIRFRLRRGETRMFRLQ